MITKGQSSNRKEGEEEEKRRRFRRRRFVPQEEKEEEEEEEEEAEIFCPSNINLIMDYAKQKNSSKAAITLHITQSFNLSLDKNGMDKKVNPRKKPKSFRDKDLLPHCSSSVPREKSSQEFLNLVFVVAVVVVGWCGLVACLSVCLCLYRW